MADDIQKLVQAHLEIMRMYLEAREKRGERQATLMEEVALRDGPLPRLVPWFRDNKKILAAADRIRRGQDRRRTWTQVEDALLLQGWEYFRKQLRAKGRRATDEQIATEILRNKLFAHRGLCALIRHHQRLVKNPKKATQLLKMCR